MNRFYEMARRIAGSSSCVHRIFPHVEHNDIGVCAWQCGRIYRLRHTVEERTRRFDDRLHIFSVLLYRALAKPIEKIRTQLEDLQRQMPA